MMVAYFPPAIVLLVSYLFLTWWQSTASILTNQIPYSYPRDTTICRVIAGLTRKQIELCYQQPDTVEAALEGLHQAVLECQHQFQTYRWNCSSLTTKARNPYTSAFFQKGYRETAFAYAIASAGIATSVAKACSQGKLIDCGCDNKKYKNEEHKQLIPSKFGWGGCSHNIHFGLKFAKMFLDSRERATDMQSKINLHNNKVGRLAVSNNMQVKCKCHGMSGSCEMKTCWRATPDFRVVGKILKEKYRTAVLMEHPNWANKPPRKKLRPTKKRRKKLKDQQQWALPKTNKHRKHNDLIANLLYYQKSPNFCDKLADIDVMGTSGRICNRTSVSHDNCSSLCCGRGYNLQRKTRTERCNCKFVWCCTVECKTCDVEEWVTICN